MQDIQNILNAPVLIQSITEQDILQDRILPHVKSLEKQIADEEAHPTEMSELLRPALIALLDSRKRMLDHLSSFRAIDQQRNQVA